MSTSPMLDEPVARAMGLVSCMRLRQRTKVRLAAARGADQRRGVVGRDVQVDVLQRVRRAVPRVQILDLNADSH